MKRLQSKIAESRFALPVAAVYALAVWLMMCAMDCREYAELAVFALSAYLMVELNNRNALIRVYSRMVSCSFLALGTMAAPAIGRLDVLAVQLCFIASYLLLFSAYWDKRAQGKMFYAFAAIGAASIIYPQSLFFVPLFWVLTATNLMAMSWRNFWASVIGLTAPYWFIAGYCAMTGDFETIAQQTSIDFWMPVPKSYAKAIHADMAVAFGLTLLVAAIGAIHFLRNSYKDKIRTRMLYEQLITLTAFTAVLAVAQPMHADMLTAILIVNSSVLAGHFIALTNTRFTNIAFVFLTALALLATLFNAALNIPWLPPQD